MHSEALEEAQRQQREPMPLGSRDTYRAATLGYRAANQPWASLLPQVPRLHSTIPYRQAVPSQPSTSDQHNTATQYTMPAVHSQGCVWYHTRGGTAVTDHSTFAHISRRTLSLFILTSDNHSRPQQSSRRPSATLPRHSTAVAKPGRGLMAGRCSDTYNAHSAPPLLVAARKGAFAALRSRHVRQWPDE